MKPLLTKPETFQPEARYTLWRFARETSSIPGFWIFPGLEVPIVGWAASGLLIFGVLVYFFIAEGPMFKTIMMVLNLLLLLTAVGSLALAGDNGRRLLYWFGLWSLAKRKKGVPADLRPISRGVTRAFFSATMALSLSLLIWWWVMKAAPVPDPGAFTDQLLLVEARLYHFLTQLGLFWWLPLFLFLPFLGLLKWMERLPVARLLLLQTKFLNIVAIPVAILVLRAIVLWATKLTGWAPTLKDFIP